VTVGGAEDGRLDLSRLDVPAALDQVIRPLKFGRSAACCSSVKRDHLANY
jgi:hypothetical protein